MKHCSAIIFNGICQILPPFERMQIGVTIEIILTENCTKIKTDQLNASNSYQMFREFEVLKAQREKANTDLKSNLNFFGSHSLQSEVFQLITILYSAFFISRFVNTAEIFEVFRKHIPYILQKVFFSQHLVRIYCSNQVTPT